MASTGRAGEKSSVHYINAIDQAERNRREFAQKKEYEENLSAVSKVSYEDVDYEPFLKVEDFPPLTLKNYDYLYPQAAKKVEADYFVPIAAQIAILVGLVIALLVFFHTGALSVIAVGVVVLIATLLYTLREKKRALERSVLMVDEEIKKRHEDEESLYKEAKSHHLVTERERINSIQNLLAGNPVSINAKIVNAFQDWAIPILLEMDIEHYHNSPLAKIWLPPKEVVPQQTCELTPAGKLEYKDKEPRLYNKQYFELILALVIKTALTILGNVPPFDRCEAWGMVKAELDDQCLINICLTRENAAYANKDNSALGMLPFVSANFNSTTNFVLSPVRTSRPVGWAGAEQKDIQSVRVKVLPR